MITLEPFMCTKLPIYYPKYSTQYQEGGERVALLLKSKVDRATPIIIVEFTKAKHLLGQRFAIHRGKAQSFPVVSNGNTVNGNCYEVPMSALDGWETPDEAEQAVIEYN